MKKFELIVGFSAIAAIILKLLHIPLSGILITLTFGILSVFYYLSFALFNEIRLKDIFKGEAYKNTNAKRIIGAIGLGFGFISIIIGSLFKLQFWPGATLQLSTGLFITCIIAIIAIFFYFRNKTDYYKKIFIRIIIIGGLGFILYLTPYSILVDIYYRNNPERAELYKKVIANPDNQEYRKQLDKNLQDNLK